MSDDSDEGDGENKHSEEEAGAVLSAEERAKVLRQRSGRGGKSRKGGAASLSNTSSANEATDVTKKPRGKQMRVWHDGTGKMSAKAMANLDRSKSSRDAGDINLAEVKATYLPDEGEVMHTHREHCILP